MVSLGSHVILTLALCVSILHAQTEVVPKVSHYIEMPYSLRMRAATACEATAHATMSRQDPSREERVLWHAPLVNNPSFTWVDTAAGWVVTMGNECSYALDHAVVVYDAAGRVVRDLRVSEILTAEEIARIGRTELLGLPRTLREDERTGNDLARGLGRVVFTADGVWLTHPRLDRLVLLVRRSG